MGAEQSTAQGGNDWGLQCAALGLDLEENSSLLACACTAFGEDDQTDDVVTERPSELETKSRSMRSGRITEEFTTTPVTFDEATGTQRFDAARRSRAQEVRDSEANFLREFSTMMRTGLTVQLRRDDDTVAVHLLLVPQNAIEWHYRDADNNVTNGRLLLDDIDTVQPNPEPQTLGFELASRSFLVQTKQCDSHLFHCDSKDISSLLVDGILMLVKRSARALRKKKRKSESEGKKKISSPSSSSSGQHLKDIQNTTL